MGERPVFRKQHIGATRQSECKNGESAQHDRSHQPPDSPICPQCGSERVWKDGLRPTRSVGSVQRYICRLCGFRFSQTTTESHVQFNVSSQIPERSEPHNDLAHDVIASLNLSLEKSINNFPFSCGEDVGSHKRTILEQQLNIFRDCNSTRRVSVSTGEAKNLATTETRQERAAGATATSADIKGKIVAFLWELKKRGLKDRSIETYQHYLLQLIKRGASLLDPESVKEVLAKQSWNENTKALAIASYSKFLEIHGGTWTPPKCRGVRKLPFIPLESELDQLISGAYPKMAAFLQLLKETGMRSGEALRLKWVEVDFKNGAITLNQPEKYGKPRMLKISSTLMAMLNALPKQNDLIFGGQNPRNYGRIYRKYRNRMAFKLQNPRLKQISFHTFRHWKATMEYHRTKDILHVMEMLGHRDIKTTLIYTQLIHFENEDFYSAVAKSVEEARSLVESGFEYVCEFEDVKLFRKRK